MRTIAILGLALLFPLAACGDGKEGTSITFNASDPDGNVASAIDGKTGKLSIDAPGFKGEISLPKLDLNDGNFEMNGVHLYPGSKISAMNIDARPGQDGAEDSGRVRVTFDSPATPDVVRAWFLDKLGKAAFKLRSEGSALVGTTDEGKPFRLDLKPAANGHAAGTITTG